MNNKFCPYCNRPKKDNEMKMNNSKRAICTSCFKGRSKSASRERVNRALMIAAKINARTA